jgi:hypothetical protein
MGDVKSQFVNSGYNDKNFLLDSFSMLGEDTRKGLSQSASSRLAAMEGFVTANPDKTSPERFTGYVNKLMNASAGEPEAKVSVAVARKPGGIMG